MAVETEGLELRVELNTEEAARQLEEIRKATGQAAQPGEDRTPIEGREPDEEREQDAKKSGARRRFGLSPRGRSVVSSSAMAGFGVGVGLIGAIPIAGPVAAGLARAGRRGAELLAEFGPAAPAIGEVVAEEIAKRVIDDPETQQRIGSMVRSTLEEIDMTTVEWYRELIDSLRAADEGFNALKDHVFITSAIGGVPLDVEMATKVFKETKEYNEQALRIARWGRKHVMGEMAEALSRGVVDMFR